jgi:hypothetical protein
VEFDAPNVLRKIGGYSCQHSESKIMRGRDLHFK